MKKAKGLRAAFKEVLGITSERELRDINVNTSLDEEKNKGKRAIREFFGLTSEHEFQAVEIDPDMLCEEQLTDKKIRREK